MLSKTDLLSHSALSHTSHTAAKPAPPSPAAAPAAVTQEEAPAPPLSSATLPPLRPAPLPVLPLNPAWFDAGCPSKVAAVRAALLDDPPPPPPGCAPHCRSAEAAALDRAADAALARPRGGVVWVTGRSGTGKSLTARAVLGRSGRVSARTAAAGGWAGLGAGLGAGVGAGAAGPCSSGSTPPAAALPSPPVVWVNCLELACPGDVYARVADGLAAFAAAAAAITAGGAVSASAAASSRAKAALAAARRAAAWRAAHPILSVSTDLPPPDRGEPGDDALARARAALAALSAPGAGGGAVIVLDEADALDRGGEGGGGGGGAGMPGGGGVAGGGPAASGAPSATVPSNRPLPPLRRLLDALTVGAPAGARAAVVAVANTVDLALRVGGAAVAPAPCGPGPSSASSTTSASSVIHFHPYDAPALATLLAARLAGLPGAAFAPRGLDLLARRVAGRCGDMRAAVGAAARALELAARDAAAAGVDGMEVDAEMEALLAGRKAPAVVVAGPKGAPSGGSGPRPLSRAPSSVPAIASSSTAPSGPAPVSMAHIAAAASAGAGADGGWDGAGGGGDADAALRALPALQQLVLVAALLAGREAAAAVGAAVAAAHCAPEPARAPVGSGGLFTGAVQRIPRARSGVPLAPPLAPASRSTLFSPAPVIPPRLRPLAAGVRLDDVATAYAALARRLGFPAESASAVREAAAALAGCGLADLVTPGEGGGGKKGGGGGGGKGGAGPKKGSGVGGAGAASKAKAADGTKAATGSSARLVPRVGLAAVRGALEGSRLAAACV